MANDDQLRILRQGVAFWNKWRKENPYVNIDLRGAEHLPNNLSEAYLRYADLREACIDAIELSKADLSEANLNGASLRYSDLREANLVGTKLSKADFREANLNEAILEHVDLSEAYLEKTKLSKADLRGADLFRANLLWADLRGADLGYARLTDAYFRYADLREANLKVAETIRTSFLDANLSKTNLSAGLLEGANFLDANLSAALLEGANLSAARLEGTNLSKANLSEANLSGAILIGTILVETNLERSTLTGCRIFGVSAWKLKLNGARQNDLIITPYNEPVVTVDNLEVAQFIYLLLNNEKIRHVIDTITSKVVLILGRFTPDRRIVLDAIREKLRKQDYLPVLFDFEKPAGRDLTETISTLAHMARFVIADITDAKAVPIELKHIVPMLPSVPVQPLILASQYEYALFDHIRGFRSVLEPYRYENQGQLLATIEEKVIAPAEKKVREIRKA